MIKVTFNKPACVAFFDGTNAKGLFIKITDEGTLSFKLSKEATGPDIVPLLPRARGSRAIEFNGTRAHEVREALRNPSGGPFFMLARKNDWIIATPFVETPGKYNDPLAAPGRIEPGMRVWSQETHRGVAVDLDANANRANAAVIAEDIIHAKQLVQDYRKSKKSGRPPIQVINAMDKIEQFEKAARLCLPIYAAAEDALEILSRVLGYDTEHLIRRRLDNDGGHDLSIEHDTKNTTDHEGEQPVAQIGEQKSLPPVQTTLPEPSAEPEAAPASKSKARVAPEEKPAPERQQVLPSSKLAEQLHYIPTPDDEADKFFPSLEEDEYHEEARTTRRGGRRVR